MLQKFFKVSLYIKQRKLRRKMTCCTGLGKEDFTETEEGVEYRKRDFRLLALGCTVSSECLENLINSVFTELHQI